MEVIEHGSTYTKTTCKQCGCKYQYTKSDINTATWSEEYYKYVKCPECQKIKKIEVF